MAFTIRPNGLQLFVPLNIAGEALFNDTHSFEFEDLVLKCGAVAQNEISSIYTSLGSFYQIFVLK